MCTIVLLTSLIPVLASHALYSGNQYVIPVASFPQTPNVTSIESSIPTKAPSFSISNFVFEDSLKAKLLIAAAIIAAFLLLALVIFLGRRCLVSKRMHKTDKNNHKTLTEMHYTAGHQLNSTSETLPVGFEHMYDEKIRQESQMNSSRHGSSRAQDQVVQQLPSNSRYHNESQHNRNRSEFEIRVTRPNPYEMV